MNNSICTLFDNILIDIHKFKSLRYIGIMGSTPYGKYYSYVKNPQQQVFVLTQNKNYLLSCENRDIFIKELSNKLSK